MKLFVGNRASDRDRRRRRTGQRARQGVARRDRRRCTRRCERIHLTDYKVRILDTNKGTGAVTRVLLDSTNGDRSWSTIGVSENIIEASWQALQDSLVYGLLHTTRISFPSVAQPEFVPVATTSTTSARATGCRRPSGGSPTVPVRSSTARSSRGRRVSVRRTRPGLRAVPGQAVPRQARTARRRTPAPTSSPGAWVWRRSGRRCSAADPSSTTSKSRSTCGATSAARRRPSLQKRVELFAEAGAPLLEAPRDRRRRARVDAAHDARRWCAPRWTSGSELLAV